MGYMQTNAVTMLADKVERAGFPRNAKAMRSEDRDPFQEAILDAMRAYAEQYEPADRMSALQTKVGRWMVEVFGSDIAMDPLERIMRFTEEAVELGQSLGLSRDETVRVVDYVYGRDVGQARQEVGGVMITLAALCFRTGIDLDGAALDEFERIDSPEMRKRIFDKQAMKRAAGLTSDGGFRADGGAA